MKRFLKLLCYSLITVFLLGLGGEKVFADINLPGSITLVDDRQGGRITWYEGQWPSYIKTAKIGGETYYVFCMDSGLHVTYNPMNLNLNLTQNTRVNPGPVKYLNGYQDKIQNILFNAYQLGFVPGQSTYNVSFTLKKATHNYTIDEKTFYGIVQMAVWNAAHGDSIDGTKGHSWWLDSDAKQYIYEYITASNFEAPYVKIIGDSITSVDNKKLALAVDENDYLVSNKFWINTNLPNNVKFFVNLSSNVSSEDNKLEISQDDGRTWVEASSNHEVDSNKSMMFRVKKPNTLSGEATIDITVTSSDVVVETKSGFYYIQGYNDTQNITVSLNRKDSLSDSIKVSGNYDNTFKLKANKVDSNGNPVAGAVLNLYKKSDMSTPIATFRSVESENDVFEIDLPDGEYCISEVSAPVGYLKTDNVVCTDDTNPKSLYLKLSNERQKVKYVKTGVDAEGNEVPLAGVRIELHKYVEENVAGLDVKYICGITDSRGLITTACDDVPSDKIYPVNSEGTFDLDPGMWNIQEEFKDGYYFEDFKMGDKVQDFFMIKRGGLGTSYRAQDYISFDGVLGQSPVITVTIKNKKYINISKVDTGTGKEIPGAEMHLYDLGVKNYSGAEEDLANDDIPYYEVEKWTSDGAPHAFVGVEPGHKYRLEETVAPTGYARLETYIEFTVDANGKVNLESVDVGQHATVPEGYNYLIIGNDLVINPPNTGISLLNKIAIGGLLVFVGYEVIKIYRKKANS